MVLGSVADLLTDDIFLEKILGNYPQPSIAVSYTHLTLPTILRV